MTTLVKKLVISGFRGIPGKLELDFCGKGDPQSMILYGRNGTGKSSISDGWEWLTSGKIEHLAREGAMESSYPHKGATGNVFVEADFSDPNVGKARLDFDLKKVTKPKASGALDVARSMIRHPCHIRHGDLAGFVFLTKSERYDALARLMGFVPQMEYQKGLRRVEGLLEKEVSQLQVLRNKAREGCADHFSGEQEPLDQITVIATDRGHATVTSLEDAAGLVEQLRKEVEQDPRAVNLAGHGILRNALGVCSSPSLTRTQIDALSSAIGEFLAAKIDAKADQLRVPFLESASRLLDSTGETGTCPLCGKGFDGDLHEHVTEELKKLTHLKTVLDSLSAAKSDVSGSLTTYLGASKQFEKALGNAKPDVDEDKLDAVRQAAEEVDKCVGELRSLVLFDSSDVTGKVALALKMGGETLDDAKKALAEAKEQLLRQSEEREHALKEDPERVKLVEDSSFVRDGVRLLRELRDARAAWGRASDVLKTYLEVVERYVEASLENVQSRFDLISGRVRTCFDILEKRTPGIAEPRLKLLRDQDRSVVLEVSFQGEEVHPAYRYLSESQLNSFGLAVFLASATHFNEECRFLVLDDVVNSFDAYKRPLLIDLLKEHFSDRQILLMTHDRFWWDNLVRFLPKWRRIEFTGYLPGTGPTARSGMSRLDHVKADLASDRADSASRELYAHLDNVVQDICERFEVELKFNRRNDYTLDTLLDRLRVRLEGKLGPNHQLAKDALVLFKANAYRNWVAHCKNPTSPIHVDEVQEVLEIWERIESAVMCPVADCGEMLSWEKGSKSFVCKCGSTKLTKAAPAAGGS